jgi:hypothetical protein
MRLLIDDLAFDRAPLRAEVVHLGQRHRAGLAEQSVRGSLARIAELERTRGWRVRHERPRE